MKQSFTNHATGQSSNRYSTQNQTLLREYLKSSHFPGFIFQIDLPKDIAYAELQRIHTQAIAFLVIFALLLAMALLLFLEILPNPLNNLSSHARQIISFLHRQDFASLTAYRVHRKNYGSLEILELFDLLEVWLQNTRKKFEEVFTINTISISVAETKDFEAGISLLLEMVSQAIQSPFLELSLNGTMDSRPYQFQKSYFKTTGQGQPIPPLSPTTHELDISQIETSIQMKLNFCNEVRERFDEAYLEGLFHQFGSLAIQLIMREKQSQNMLTGELIREFMSSVPEDTKGIDIATVVKTARYLGGDFLHIQKVKDDVTAFAISDVSGKGPGPAVFGQACKSMLEILLEAQSDLPNLLDKLNLYLTTDKRDMLFATMFLARFNPSDKTLTWSAAGHNRMLFVPEVSAEIEELNQQGMALAMMPGASYPATKIETSPGDRLVLYTDGLMDLKNPEGQNFEIDRFKSFLTENASLSSKELAKALETRIEEFRDWQPYPDDLSVIIATIL